MHNIQRAHVAMAAGSIRPAPPVGDAEAKEIETRVRESGSSFFYAMRLLPQPRRQSMYALYAFCREVDDIADGVGAPALKLSLLSRWRDEIGLLYAHQPRRLATRCLQQAVDEYRLRVEDFLAVIDGMEMDARADIQAPSSAELDLYCSRVAVAVGLLSARIFGVESEAADRLADRLGRALQLTNILRDLDEDANRNRLYLPRELLQFHGISAGKPRTVLSHPALDKVCADLAARAQRHFAGARQALSDCPKREMSAAALMLDTYQAVLQSLVARGWWRLKDPVRISAWRKGTLLARHALISRIAWHGPAAQASRLAHYCRRAVPVASISPRP